MVIQVGSLTFHSGASILDDPHVKQLFVAYKFLDYDPADLETPISLPKPAPDRPISYNYKKGKTAEYSAKLTIACQLVDGHPRQILFVISRVRTLKELCHDILSGLYGNSTDEIKYRDKNSVALDSSISLLFCFFCFVFQFFMWMQRTMK